jgi:hypothetical protein
VGEPEAAGSGSGLLAKSDLASLTVIGNRKSACRQEIKHWSEGRLWGSNDPIKAKDLFMIALLLHATTEAESLGELDSM